jgi:UDP-2,3-diacylglucosamine pyrophosphatase LpxH
MIISAFSDIHKKPKRYEDVNITDSEFVNILIKLSEKSDMVYINGDYLDIWCSIWPTETSQIVVLKKLLKRYHKTFKYILENPKIKIIIGNHDHLLHKLHKLNENSKVSYSDTIINSNNQKILIWHGNVDLLNSKLISIGAFLAWIEYQFEKIFKICKLIKLVNFMKKAIHFFGFKNKMQIKDFKTKIKQDDDLVMIVNGHTHVKEIHKFEQNNKQRTYVNTGFFNYNHPLVTAINTETLDVKQANIL